MIGKSVVANQNMNYLYYLFILFLCGLSLPILACIYIIKLIIDGSPALFVQERAGLGGKPFLMYKFRTMIVGAEDLQNEYRKLNEAKGPVFKIRNDPRFTPFGKFLSHTGLDELPQLVNVLRGEMALIGPRPLPLSEAHKLAPWMKKRHEVKPGIISPWILNGYHRQTFSDWMRSDLKYAKTKSLLTDGRIALRSLAFISNLFFQEITKKVRT
jgi:lipopolysaccharide/colanic/teichoic acid biosynthesis glycosyltransferase